MYTSGESLSHIPAFVFVCFFLNFEETRKLHIKDLTEGNNKVNKCSLKKKFTSLFKNITR